MNVYFSSGFLPPRPCGRKGRIQRTHESFSYRGLSRLLPALYRFPQGVVFDLLTPLTEGSSVREEQLVIPLASVSIQGEKADAWEDSGQWFPAQDSSDLERQLRSAYPQLRAFPSFFCQRCCISWPESEASFLRRLSRRLRIRRLEFTTPPGTEFPLERRFSLPAKGACSHTEVILHPRTETEHTLFFFRTELEHFPLNPQKHYYFSAADYEISPALPQGDSLAFCSSLLVPQPSSGPLAPDAVGTIGIIGGASGPTMIQADPEGSLGPHGLIFQSCFSVPAGEPLEAMEFQLEGIRCQSEPPQAFSFSL